MILEAPAFMLALLGALFFFLPLLFLKLSKQCSSHQDLGCVCLEYKVLLAFIIRKEHMKPSEITWVDQSTASRSVSSGFVHWLWWIIRIERYVYKNLRLFSSGPLKPRQVGRTLSGVSRDVWALIGPLKDLHCCPQTTSVMEPCRWWEVMLLSGHSDWWSSAVVVDLLELSPTCTQDLSKREHWGSLVTLVPATQLEGLIQTDETLSKPPPVNWIYGRRRRLCTCQTRQRWNVVEYKYLAVWSQGGCIEILLLQSRNILIPKRGT